MDMTELPSGLHLNLGCGPVQPAGWINIDGSNRAYLASNLHWIDNLMVKCRIIPPTHFSKSIKYCNLLKGIPYPNNSIACIYAGELWEHFERPDALNLTKECFRVLKPKGVLRVCVPDGPTFWGKYLEIYHKEMSKPRKDRNAKPLVEHTQMFFNEICTRKRYLGSMGHTHKWNFDEVQLIEMFEVSGFSCVERMQFQKSRIPDIDCIERSDFLIVEGIK
jgi:predicted SAM-dependent methyltransferase